MTSMEAWGEKLTDQEIWKVVAYQRNFGLRGKIYDPKTDQWLDPLTDSSRISEKGEGEK